MLLLSSVPAQAPSPRETRDPPQGVRPRSTQAPHSLRREGERPTEPLPRDAARSSSWGYRAAADHPRRPPSRGRARHQPPRETAWRRPGGQPHDARETPPGRARARTPHENPAGAGRVKDVDLCPNLVSARRTVHCSTEGRRALETGEGVVDLHATLPERATIPHEGRTDSPERDPVPGFR